MIKFIGHADIPGKVLKYYVFGTRKSGYWVRICSSEETSEQFFSRNLSETLALADQLRRCTVFPFNLSEIIEDMKIS